MYASNYIFSKRFFTGWIVVTFLWGFFGALTITCLPLFESRHSIIAFFAALLKDVTGKTATSSVKQEISQPTDNTAATKHGTKEVVDAVDAGEIRVEQKGNP